MWPTSNETLIHLISFAINWQNIQCSTEKCGILILLYVSKVKEYEQLEKVYTYIK